MYSVEIMNEIPSDFIAKLQEDIKQRDKLIEEQTSRIEHLENEVEKVRKERDRLSTKSYTPLIQAAPE